MTTFFVRSTPGCSATHQFGVVTCGPRLSNSRSISRSLIPIFVVIVIVRSKFRWHVNGFGVYCVTHDCVIIM